MLSWRNREWGGRIGTRIYPGQPLNGVASMTVHICDSWVFNDGVDAFLLVMLPGCRVWR
jgi:hypothetical protein